MKVLMISADDFEDTELLVPYYRLKEEGIALDIASLRGGTIKGKHGYEAGVDRLLDQVRPEEYDLLLLPGGKAPEKIRTSGRAQEIARHFFSSNKPVAAICHGPLTLISAGLLNGRAATGYASIVPELKAAGVRYEDREVVIDGNLITSRQPSDLPAFLRAVMSKIRSMESVERKAA